MPRSRIVQIVAAGVGTLVLLIAGGIWWAGKQAFETTDNAFVAADTVSVSPLISSHVAEVLVADNQGVTAGQVLIRLDPADPQARLAQAQANLAALQAAVKSVDDKSALEQAMIAERAAGVASAQAMARTAQLDEARYGKLQKQGWVSEQGYQNAQASAQQTAANVAQAQATFEAERRTASSLGSARAQSLAQVQAARAAVDQAQTDLDRTVIRAPISGVVGARAVRQGQFVQPGITLLAIVPLGQTYVVANFKETQVARIRIGQPVEIRADAFGGKPIKGRIDSFAPATGSEFALIPVENAVGNFTKVVQRVPVKIAVDRGDPAGAGLRPGLSVVIKVDVRSQTGASFAQSGEAQPMLAQQPGGPTTR